ncbi:uncharacterized protein PAN0_032d6244 [Moesziomyces antarcticus]|uniref:Uncharacterized protein n=2 Tax=Pseudozyma antarctica TaxID=84753 RepID=A0A081CMW8_PSEA2|nr:uncharacterized protein PAN0_032d6244 [Moesziomyces antarcticus]GAK68014.1 conserved hypothetical protein [Moesziomyces antarcticus]SPO49231.1 related to conserved hypothetcial protein [Moesziomyces antarcticus]
MSTAMQPRALPTITVFTHPAARLIKTVPPLEPPKRINGHVPRDNIGVGRTASKDVVLTDVYGPLSILVVPDPLDPTIATLVLSVTLSGPQLQGAARRFVLPFRSFQRDPVSGDIISQSKISGFDAADRTLYPGLGAGLKGLDGGSFWFFEDIGEDGAFDRYRWSKDGVASRAIWTVWLISTPAPVVHHVQALLQSYPAPLPSLPPWLKENNGYPWKDTFLALPSSSLASSSNSEDHDQPAEGSASPLVSSDASSAITTPSAKLDLAADTLSSLTHEATAVPTIRSRRLRDGSSSMRIGDAPEVVLRNVNRNVTHSEYRNSLVAVDNRTGQIVSVLASHISLEADDPAVASTASSSEPDLDAHEDHEAITPLDELVPALPDKSPSQALGSHPAPLPLSQDLAEEQVDEEEHGSETPKPSTIVHRPAAIHNDPDAQRPPSRTASILAADTFAPPPLPPKPRSASRARAHSRTTADAPASRRTSTASAFFTAESDADAMSSYDSDAIEIDASSISHHNLPSSSISIRGHASHDVEKHRPELLRDANHADSDGEYASDASGSTVGGPAVRMWRKARGKPKKKPARAVQKAGLQSAHPTQRVKSRQASELSDRTSKAETALESISDDEAVQQPQGRIAATTDSNPPSPEQDIVSPLKSAQPSPGVGQHLRRSALRTDEVRSIEDRVWREALDASQLPIDAPYTHLAARGEAGFYPSSILSSPRSFDDGSAIELLSTEDKRRQVQRKKAELHKQNQRAERIKNMQGGTVLIEFLAGSSRIGASLIRSAGYTPTTSNDEGVHDADSNTHLSAGDTASNMLSYVPVLPQHVLGFFGLGTRTVRTQVEETPDVSSPTLAGAYFSSLRMPSLGGLLTDASDWVTGFFGRSSVDAKPSTAVEVEGDGSKAEEWEYAIPDFDPNSLASTPRPVYRRKRPVPSAMNGFNISAPRCSDDPGKGIEVPAPPSAAAKTIQTAETASTEEAGYSILHIDSLGVGRRAFLRGHPEFEGLRP